MDTSKNCLFPPWLRQCRARFPAQNYKFSAFRRAKRYFAKFACTLIYCRVNSGSARDPSLPWRKNPSFLKCPYFCKAFKNLTADKFVYRQALLIPGALAIDGLG